MPNGSDYLELIYACARLGVIVVPLNVRLSVVEIDRILADASPHGLIRHSSLPVPTVPLAWQLVLDQEPLDLGDDGSRSAPINDPDAVLALIYTSGTTGHPKGVVVTHANILANVEHFDYWMPHKDGAVHLHAAPLFHIADFPVMFAAPAFGAAQVTIPRFTPQDFCQTVERARVSHTVLVPTMINLLTQFPELEKYDLASLEEIAYGGSPMAPELIRRTREVLPGVRLVQGYGLSETGFLTALRDDEHVGRRLTSCGRPAPGIEVRVVDGSGAEVKAGEAGELIARGANVMRGYWNNPKETAQAFLDGWFRTGDVGRQDADGFFYILDRLKDMIVTGGENVYSGEVEAVIYQHPAVHEAAVFGIPDRKWGELVAACVVLKPGSAQRRRTDRSLPAIPRQLQGAAAGRVLGHRAAEKRDRQDPQAGFAGALLGSPRAGGELMTSSRHLTWAEIRWAIALSSGISCRRRGSGSSRRRRIGAPAG